jgi:hypothetical protein
MLLKRALQQGLLPKTTGWSLLGEGVKLSGHTKIVQDPPAKI